MEPDKTAKGKPYSQPKLKRFDPQDVLPRVKAAALAGNKNAQAMLDRISGK